MNPTQMSNAFNFKVEGDAVTNVPPHIGSTTYGKDLLCKVSLMSNNIFKELFTDAEADTLDEAVSVSGHGDIYGLHDTCLGLIVLMDIAEKIKAN